MKNNHNAANPIRFSQIKTSMKTAFFAVGALLSFSCQLQGSSQKGSDDEPYKFPGISMKTGFAITPSSQKELQDQYRRSLLKGLASAARARAQTAKHIFAFKHNFLIPQWLREYLPPEVSSKLLELNMFNVTLNISKPFQEMQVTTAVLLHCNGLNADPVFAAMSPNSRLVRLVNEAGFEQDAAPFEKAKTLALLAMRLDTYNTFGLTHEESDGMMAALYNKAAQETLSIAPELPGVVLADLYTSAGQLKRWSSYHTADSKEKTTHVVDSLELFSRARQYIQVAENSVALLAKIKNEQHLALDSFEEILLSRGLAERGVKRFIASSRLQI